jgi:peroxiredoxin Q/BCP
VHELREFRAHHDAFRSAGITVAGVSFETPEAHRRTVERFELPFPLLSDRDRAAARAFGFLDRVGLGPWSVELLRRATVLIASDGHVAAIWSRVRLRGHAEEVLAMATALAADERAR